MYQKVINSYIRQNFSIVRKITQNSNVVKLSLSVLYQNFYQTLVDKKVGKIYFNTYIITYGTAKF
jgi:hypothetical protein